jgi:C-terminal processing protease CtpA/Prc
VPTVLGVRAGTAGAGAGLAKGDAILAVDGAPTTGITLAQLRTLLMGPAGTVVHLHVKNATGERDATLTLHDYV